MKNKIKSLLNRNDIVFILAGIIMFALFSFAPIIADDAVFVNKFSVYGLNGALAKAAEEVIVDWNTWSSRILVNYTWLATLILGRFFFSGMTGILTYAFLKAISILFETKKIETNLKITCLFFLFPFIIWSSAGWYATTVTYYWPVVMGVIALVPIAKCMRDEQMKKWEYVVYSIMLIYCANSEQGMVFILFTYSTILIFCLVKRKKIVYLFVQEFLAIGSMFICLLNPGNMARKIAETGNWFPEYGMLSALDKAEMGMSTTFHTLLFSSNALIIASCAILLGVVYRIYKDAIIRFLAGIPLYVTVIFGPLRNIAFTMFPQLDKCVNDIPKLGTVNVETYDTHVYLIEFFLLTISCIIVVYNIILINGNKWKTYFLVSLLLGGAAGRVAMGFSPTIYASGIRTFSNLLLIFVVIGAAIIAKGDEMKKSNSDKGIMLYVLGAMAGICNIASVLI